MLDFDLKFYQINNKLQLIIKNRFKLEIINTV